MEKCRITRVIFSTFLGIVWYFSKKITHSKVSCKCDISTFSFDSRTFQNTLFLLSDVYIFSKCQNCQITRAKYANETTKKMSDDPSCRITRGKCRITRVKMHGKDRNFDGTEQKMSDDPSYRMTRGRISRVALYYKFILIFSVISTISLLLVK